MQSRHMGATDELSHTLGRKRVHLGMNMPGLAHPLDPASSDGAEEVVCYFGIIDILQASV